MIQWTHTFWSAPALGPYPLAGYCSWEAFARVAVLSCVWLRRYNGGNARLVADRVGAEWIIDRLGCPYDYVDASLDAPMTGVSPALFAAAKVHAYGRGCNHCPVQHVDVDFLSQHKLIGEPEKYEVVVSNLEGIESVREIYWPGVRFIKNYLRTDGTVWDGVNPDLPEEWPMPGNVSVLMIRDPEVKWTYIEEFWRLVKDKHNLKTLNAWLANGLTPDKRTSINCCLEQMTLALVCQKLGVEMTPIFKQTSYAAIHKSVINGTKNVMHLIKHKEHPDGANNWLDGMRAEFRRDPDLQRHETRVMNFDPENEKWQHQL